MCFIRIFSLLLFTSVFISPALAQEIEQPDSSRQTPWNSGGVFSLNISQAAFSNWVAGGENSVAASSLIDSYLHFNTETVTWENNLKVGYGLMHRDETGMIKTDDKIKYTSKYGRQLKNKWFYSALLDFKTQFAPGYETLEKQKRISDFLAPAYLVYSLGFDYRPREGFNMFIAPLTGKTTYVGVPVLYEAGAYGVTPGEKYRSEFGGYIDLNYQKKVMENITFRTKVNLFSNYLNKPQNIDVDWEVLLAMQVNKYISANITTHLIYDDDILIDTIREEDGEVIGSSPKIQFKEVLGIGLSYNFGD